jgi:hypothetical protein
MTVLDFPIALHQFRTFRLQIFPLLNGIFESLQPLHKILLPLLFILSRFLEQIKVAIQRRIAERGSNDYCSTCHGNVKMCK